MNVQDEARRVLKIEADAIMEVRGLVGESFDRAVARILECRGRVVVTGMGKSGLIGRKIAATLASVGAPAFFIHPAEGGHGDIGMLTRGDCALVISRSGETEEVLAILPALKRLGLPLIVMTAVSESTLARESDTILEIRVREEACPMDLVPTASTTATLALGDALAVAVMKRRGMKEEDYALLHPAGSLGRRLLLRVEDIMRKGDELSRVGEGSSLQEAILEMTAKKMGATCVVDESGALLGIMTDHDLRRALAVSGADIVRATVDSVMTSGPLTVRKEMLAAEAIRITETRQVSVLPVVDEGGILVGIVHLHDLLRSGVT